MAANITLINAVRENENARSEQRRFSVAPRNVIDDLHYRLKPKSTFSQLETHSKRPSICYLDTFTNELNPRVSLEPLSIGDGGMPSTNLANCIVLYIIFYFTQTVEAENNQIEKEWERRRENEKWSKRRPSLLIKTEEKGDTNEEEEKRKAIKKRWQKVGQRVILMNRSFKNLKKVKETIRLLGVANKYSIDKLNENKSGMNEYCIILPDSKFKISWNIVVITLLLFTAIYIPYRVSFLDKVSTGWLVVEYLVDILFFTDIPINFLSAYMDNEKNLVTEKKKIAINYLKGWFIIDAIACIPFQFFSDSNESSQYNKLFRLLRLGRLYRLIRMIAFVRMSNIFKNNKGMEKVLLALKLNAGIKRLFLLILMLLFLLHLFSCLWFFFAKINEFPPDCWVVRHGFRDSSNSTQYMASLFWVATLISVGYAHIFPETTTEQILSLIFMFSGVSFYTYALGTITSILTSSDTKYEKFRSKLLALDELAQTYNMPHELYFRIKKIIKNNNESSYYSHTDHSEIMEELPGSIKSELKTLLYEEPLKKIQFFQNKDPVFINMILPSLRRINIEKDDFIYKAKDWADEVYFLLKGRVDLVTRSGISFIYYIDGSYFGELEILSEQDYRDHTALAHENCELLAINKDILIDILEKFPLVHEEMNRILNLRKLKNTNALSNATKSNLLIENKNLNLLNPSNSIKNALYQHGLSSFFRQRTLKKQASHEDITEILNFEEMKAENKLGKIPLHGRNLTQPSKGGSLRWSKGVLTIEEQRAKHGDTYDSDPVIYINKPSNMVAESPIRGKESNWTDESESQSESSGQYSKESRTGLDITSRKVKLETENSLEANEGKLGNGEELGVDDSLAGLNIPQNLPSNDNSSGDEIFFNFGG